MGGNVLKCSLLGVLPCLVEEAWDDRTTERLTPPSDSTEASTWGRSGPPQAGQPGSSRPSWQEIPVYMVAKASRRVSTGTTPRAHPGDSPGQARGGRRQWAVKRPGHHCGTFLPYATGVTLWFHSRCGGAILVALLPDLVSALNGLTLPPLGARARRPSSRSTPAPTRRMHCLLAYGPRISFAGWWQRPDPWNVPWPGRVAGRVFVDGSLVADIDSGPASLEANVSDAVSSGDDSRATC